MESVKGFVAREKNLIDASTPGTAEMNKNGNFNKHRFSFQSREDGSLIRESPRDRTIMQPLPWD